MGGGGSVRVGLISYHSDLSPISLPLVIGNAVLSKIAINLVFSVPRFVIF